MAWVAIVFRYGLPKTGFENNQDFFLTGQSASGKGREQYAYFMYFGDWE